MKIPVRKFSDNQCYAMVLGKILPREPLKFPHKSDTHVEAEGKNIQKS